MRKPILIVILLLLLASSAVPTFAQGGPGTKDFAIRDFGACINLPDFTNVLEPDPYNTVYQVPGLFSINFAEYLMPLSALPNNSTEIYNAMISLLNTVNASNYQRITFNHTEYVSAAVEFTLDGQRMFGMIYRNQSGKLFFLFADKVAGFDMLAIGRAIFAADAQCAPLNLVPVTVEEDSIVGNPDDVLIIPVENTPAQVSLTANGSSDGTTINAGECATIQWVVENVQSVYFDGQGVPGHASTQVCPTGTQAYTLHVNKTDGSSIQQQIVVTVSQSAGVPASTTSGQLDWNLTPTFGSTALTSGFLNDPYRVDMPLQDGTVSVGQTLGCTGIVDAAPDFSLSYTAGGSGRLRFYVTANEHTVLVINDPNGQWHCSDQDSPIITFSNPAGGRYDIWVGREGNLGNVYNLTGSYAALWITELDLYP